MKNSTLSDDFTINIQSNTDHNLLLCSECGKDIKNKTRHYNLGDKKWRCEKCFLKKDNA